MNLTRDYDLNVFKKISPLNWNQYFWKFVKSNGTCCPTAIAGADILVQCLTHCGLEDFHEILTEYFSSQLQWLMAEIPAVKLPSEECH